MDIKYLGHTTEDIDTGEKYYKICNKAGVITYLDEGTILHNKLDISGLIRINNKVVEKKYAAMSDELNKLLHKSKILGLEITEMPTYCDSKVYLIKRSKDNYILVIPQDVQYIRKDNNVDTFSTKIKEIRGKLKVIGGDNLESLRFVFSGCKLSEIDLTELNTINVTSMDNAFSSLRGTNLNFGGKFTTKNVTNMEDMFAYCEITKLDLSSFDTSNVKSMGDMFRQSIIENLNLSSFDTRNVKSFTRMFYKYSSGVDNRILNLKSFNSRNCEYFHDMFFLCDSTVITNDINIQDCIWKEG